MKRTLHTVEVVTPEDSAQLALPDEVVVSLAEIVGAAKEGLLALAVGTGLSVLHETVRSRASSAGRFVSVSISFQANSRSDYDTAHIALRAHPEVKWTL